MKESSKNIQKLPKEHLSKEPLTVKSKKDDPDLARLAKRIRALRIEKGYTNADFFAYENNITRTQYNRYENGENIKYTSLIKLIRAFGLTPKEFFAEGFD